MAMLYADEDFPRPTSEILRNFGHDVLTCRESGRAGHKISDEMVLAYAISTGRTVLTKNRTHFKRLHRKNANHFGIVACSQYDDFKELAQRIQEKLAAETSMKGKLIHVYRPG